MFSPWLWRVGIVAHAHGIASLPVLLWLHHRSKLPRALSLHHHRLASTRRNHRKGRLEAGSSSLLHCTARQTASERNTNRSCPRLDDSLGVQSTCARASPSLWTDNWSHRICSLVPFISSLVANLVRAWPVALALSAQDGRAGERRAACRMLPNVRVDCRLHRVRDTRG